jgi:hypothetical protein
LFDEFDGLFHAGHYKSDPSFVPLLSVLGKCQLEVDQKQRIRLHLNRSLPLGLRAR